MKKRIYYVVESGDGSPESPEFATLGEARKELKRYIKEDKEEFDLDPGEMDYYITKYTETDGVLYYEEVK